MEIDKDTTQRDGVALQQQSVAMSKKPAAVTLEQIENWKEEYGDVYKLTGEPENEGDQPLEYYFRKPGRAHLSRLSKELMKDALRAMENLVVGCLLHPSEEVLRAQLQKRPGVVVALGGELQKIIGTNQDFFTKKL